MKKLSFILLACAVLFSCQTPTARRLAFIPGAYATTASSELSSARDTLVFTRLDQNHFGLVRRTAYQPVRNGKRLPWRHWMKEFRALWDPLKQELTEEKTGLVFRFDVDKGVLLVGKAVYHKIN